MHDGSVIGIDRIRAGDRLRTADGGYTTVKHIDAKEYLGDVYIVGDARLTGAHAVRVASFNKDESVGSSRWHSADEVGRSEQIDEPTTLYRIQADEYCRDVLETREGIFLETWDGRPSDAWRPHYYDEHGTRRRCGYGWDGIAWIMDVISERLFR
jgi:hypothetical protein